MPVLPIDPELRPPYRRRALMRAGSEAAWWVYESENPAGYVAGGVTYDEVTYTVRALSGRRVTLLAAEVDGFLGAVDDAAALAAFARIVEHRTAE